MSTFTGLTTMVRGIYLNQTSLNTVGHNIVNAATPGYSRQSTNPVATASEHRAGLYNTLEVGTGVDALSITRSRDTFADFQFRQENSTKGYYETMANNFDKIEVIFNDATNVGVADAMSALYKAWSALSTEGPTAANRTTVIEKSKIFSDEIQTAAQRLQEQINAQYDEIKNHTIHVDETLEQLRILNRQVVAAEADGSMANDLRDQRDLLTDELASYFNLSVTETELGAYQIVGNGAMLVNGYDRLHLQFDDAGVSSALYGVDYGVQDHQIRIKESDVVFAPNNGILKAHYDAIQDCKDQLDTLANMASYMLTALNDQHAAGYDMNGDTGINFFGVTGYDYAYEYDPENMYNYMNVTDTDGNVSRISGIKIINSMNVNAYFDQVGGYKYVAAATAYKDVDDNNEWIKYTADTDMDAQDANGNYIYKLAWGNRTGDGTNAVYISELFNMPFDTIVEAGRSNANIIQKYTLKDLKGNEVLDSNGNKTYITPLGQTSLNSYYQEAMTQVSVEASSLDATIEQHDIIMTQIENWRDSTSGVDWNQELTEMIKFQKAYQSCARCLTAMDECLDRLVNNTGMVGR